MNRLQLQTSCPAQRSETGGCARCVRACVCSVARVPPTSVPNINFKHQFQTLIPNINFHAKSNLMNNSNALPASIPNINFKRTGDIKHQTSNALTTSNICSREEVQFTAHRTWSLIDWTANFNESLLQRPLPLSLSLYISLSLSLSQQCYAQPPARICNKTGMRSKSRSKQTSIN